MNDNVFDIGEGRKLRDQGMLLAADNRRYALRRAQKIAQELGRQQLFVTADDVCSEMEKRGLYKDYQNLENARGSLFKKKCWIWTGGYVLSKRPSRHANSIRVWMYCKT